MSFIGLVLQRINWRSIEKAYVNIPSFATFVPCFHGVGFAPLFFVDIIMFDWPQSSITRAVLQQKFYSNYVIIIAIGSSLEQSLSYLYPDRFTLLFCHLLKLFSFRNRSPNHKVWKLVRGRMHVVETPLLYIT